MTNLEHYLEETEVRSHSVDHVFFTHLKLNIPQVSMLGDGQVAALYIQYCHATKRIKRSLIPVGGDPEDVQGFRDWLNAEHEE